MHIRLERIACISVFISLFTTIKLTTLVSIIIIIVVDVVISYVLYIYLSTGFLRAVVITLAASIIHLCVLLQKCICIIRSLIRCIRSYSYRCIANSLIVLWYRLMIIMHGCLKCWWCCNFLVLFITCYTFH